MRQTILLFGSISVILFLLIQLAELSIYHLENRFVDLFILLISLSFLLIGFYAHRLIYSTSHKKLPKQKNKSELSKQEYRILCLMNDGLSNCEIAERLFIAESTVKKHVSNILFKLSAKRRTEAIKIGRDLEIL